MYSAQFRTVLSQEDPVADVIWFHHAGGSTAALVATMRSLTHPPAVRVICPVLPAREQSTDQSFEGTLDQLAGELATAWSERDDVPAERPLVIIGHSFGSVLAYRFAAELYGRGTIARRLVVLSFAPPDQLRHHPPLHQLDDKQLVQKVDSLFGGIPDDLQHDPAAHEFFLPALRLDLRLLECYEHQPATPLPIPIVAISGTEDSTVDLTQMQGWERFTSAAFRLRSMPGDHFFPADRASQVLQVALWDLLPG